MVNVAHAAHADGISSGGFINNNNDLPVTGVMCYCKKICDKDVDLIYHISMFLDFGFAMSFGFTTSFGFIISFGFTMLFGFTPLFFE